MSNEKGVPEFYSDSVTSDDIAHTSADTLAKFRSISLKHENLVEHNNKSINFGKGDLSIESNLFTKSRNSVFDNLTKNSNVNTCPERPYTLMRTHFELDSAKMGVSKDGKSKFEKIVETMNICLTDFSEYDFTFFPPGDCMWKGKFLQGSSHCEIHVHIYSNSPSPVYIIEANRVEGDSKPFFNFYREFKSLMLNVADEKPVNNFFFDPLPSCTITKEQFLGGIKPIFIMAKESFYESRLEGVKMLCDLAAHPEKPLLQLPECREKVLECLETLVTDNFDHVRQHTMCAFALFVEVPGYAEAMAVSKSLAVLLNYIENPQQPAYETIQARRECARVLAFLAKNNAAAALSNLRANAALDEFFARVDGLQDQKLKNQAVLLRDRLNECIRQQQQPAAAGKK